MEKIEDKYAITDRLSPMIPGVSGTKSLEVPS